MIILSEVGLKSIETVASKESSGNYEFHKEQILYLLLFFIVNDN